MSMLALGLIKRTTWVLYDIASLEWTGRATGCHWEATGSHLAVRTYSQDILCRPAAHGGSIVVWVMGPLQLASTRVPVLTQRCPSLPKLHPLLSPLPWPRRQLSSLTRPFGARLQSRCPARTLCCAGLLFTSYSLDNTPYSMLPSRF